AQTATAAEITLQQRVHPVGTRCPSPLIWPGWSRFLVLFGSSPTSMDDSEGHNPPSLTGVLRQYGSKSGWLDQKGASAFGKRMILVMIPRFARPHRHRTPHAFRQSVSDFRPLRGRQDFS